MLLVFAPVTAALLDMGHAGAMGEYTNAKIADTALGYVGEWGGNACVDAQKPGDYGGQCRSFVNCVVWMASNHAQNLGGFNYFSTFLHAGGHRITSASKLIKGDIVQEGQGIHTYIIIKHVSGNVFKVVDSNHEYREVVRTYDRHVTLNSYTRAYRMGMVLKSKTTKKNTPDGELATVKAVPGGALVKGWALDPNTQKAVHVDVYGASGRARPGINPSVSLTASVKSKAVPDNYHSYGSHHGFEGFIVLPAGTQTVCAYAHNADDTPGHSVKKIGCETVSIP